MLVFITISATIIIIMNLTEAKDNGKGKRADETMKNELNTTKEKDLKFGSQCRKILILWKMSIPEHNGEVAKDVSKHIYVCSHLKAIRWLV